MAPDDAPAPPADLDRERAFDLVLLGHVALDENVVLGQARRELGGAVYFGAFAARVLCPGCLVVTKLAPADTDRLAVFAQAGLAVHWTPSRRTAGIRNIYTTADQDRRTCILLDAGDPFAAGDLARVQARILHVGGLLAGQVPEALLLELAGRFELGLDLQGVLRVAEADRLELRPWPAAAEVLGGVTYLKADAAEAEVLTGETDPKRVARALAALGPREVVLTCASGVTVLASGELLQDAFDPIALRGRTGRGDTCMAAYLSARLAGHPPAWATRWAAALTSLKLEQPGPFAGTRQEVLARMG